MNQLKEAEKKASSLVQDARKARVDRMKEAKVEAEQIIQAYKAEMESTYQKSLSAQTGSRDLQGNELQSVTDAEIRKIGTDFNRNKEQVEKMLTDLVCTVKIEATKSRG